MSTHTPARITHDPARLIELLVRPPPHMTAEWLVEYGNDSCIDLP